MSATIPCICVPGDACDYHAATCVTCHPYCQGHPDPAPPNNTMDNDTNELINAGAKPDVYTIELDLADVEYEIACLPEYEPPENHFDSGDAEYDQEDARKIRESLEAGNEWAWCTVEVTATIGIFQGTAYLGCCSYASEDDFRTSETGDGGYFDSLKDEAVEDLVGQIRLAGGRLSK